MNDNIKKEFKDRGILIPEIQDKTIIKQIRKIIKDFFCEDADFYQKMSRADFQDHALKCQNSINQQAVQERFHTSEKKLFDSLYPGEELLHESVVFLRAVRPICNSVQGEHPDFHRETFYSDHSHTPYVLNIWMPILNVNEDNTLRYIPESHLIPDSEIIIESNDDWVGRVNKFSSGHKMGMFWAPKRIISGVDLYSQKKIFFPEYTYSLFSSMLVHGGAENRSNSIRFVIGWGVIPKARMTYNKKFFAAEGKSHYMAIE